MNKETFFLTAVPLFYDFDQHIGKDKNSSGDDVHHRLFYPVDKFPLFVQEHKQKHHQHVE